MTSCCEAELQFARYSDCLSHLPFLEQLLASDCTQEGHIMQTLAQRAVAVLDSAEDDVVFCNGCSPKDETHTERIASCKLQAKKLDSF